MTSKLGSLVAQVTLHPTPLRLTHDIVLLIKKNRVTDKKIWGERVLGREKLYWVVSKHMQTCWLDEKNIWTQRSCYFFFPSLTKHNPWVLKSDPGSDYRGLWLYFKQNCSTEFALKISIDFTAKLNLVPQIFHCDTRVSVFILGQCQCLYAACTASQRQSLMD